MADAFPPSPSPSPKASFERLPSAGVATTPGEILLIEAEPLAAEHSAVLRQTSRVVSTAHPDVATQYLVKGAPSLVVVDADGLPDIVGLVRAAKTLSTPAIVLALVAAAEVNRVPALLAAGCDAILLKPFAKNLLYARIGRLLRASTQQQRLRARQDQTRSPYTVPDGHNGGDGALATTNRIWADMVCPQCQHDGAVSFEFASHRRAWYACLECKAVWMAKRRE